MTDKNLPARVEPLQRIPTEFRDWNALIEAIREEARGAYITKSQLAVQAGLWDATISYFWNAVIEDLRRKVLAYGIEYFAAEMNNPRITGEESLVQLVNDYLLIEGCYKLGILDREAWFQLQHARDLRNYFSAAHPAQGEIDPLEVLNFIKNCIKYVLAADLPAPGFELRALLDDARQNDITPQLPVIETALKSQPQKLYDTLVNILFTEYVDPNCPGILKRNINKLAPIVWTPCSEDCKQGIGQRYAKISIEGPNARREEAFTFLRLVDGVRYIPEQIRKALFDAASQRLINAHFGANNFYTEPDHANVLLDLGFNIPQGAESRYVKAILLSFLGNMYGESFAAQTYLEQMIDNFNQRCLAQVFELIDNDRDLILTLLARKPLARLKILAQLLQDRAVPTRYARRLHFFLNASEKDLQDYFEGRQEAAEQA